MTGELDRDQLIFAITLQTNYAKIYLEKLEDAELLKIYERVMKRG